jgi:hypothetical protein
LSYRRPDWLPDLIECSGDWNKTLERLYAIFERDFSSRPPQFRNKKLWWNRRVKAGEVYPEGFWHLITRTDQKTGERLPDYRRAERLCWCRPVIEHYDQPEVTTWDADKQGRIRTYLWVEPEDYVVVLESRGTEIAFLITAYFIDGESSRRSLRRSYADRL